MNSPEQDRKFFEAGLQELEPYLLSKELYWRSPVQTTDFTQVTPGVMLLVRERMRGRRSLGLEQLSATLDAVRSKWRSAWETKARREVRARSEMWKEYLAEARGEPSAAVRQYSYQVRLRVILNLLLDDLGEQPSEALQGLDASLKRMWHPAAFVWEAALEWVFPKESFWFLYGTPTAQEK